jgi:hypothetical protein
MEETTKAQEKKFNWNVMPGRVLAQQLESVQEPESNFVFVENKPNRAIVITVGDGCDPTIKKGCEIVFLRSMGAPVKLLDTEGQSHELIIVRNADIDLVGGQV